MKDLVSRSPADFEALIEVITSAIEPDSWQDVGGPGYVKELENTASLVISQRADVHDQVGRLLTTLRKVKSVQGLTTESSRPVINRYAPAISPSLARPR